MTRTTEPMPRLGKGTRRNTLTLVIVLGAASLGVVYMHRENYAANAVMMVALVFSLIVVFFVLERLTRQ
ncbi:hypothetical protein [Rufibacter hautae]|uniref:Uncharacterized protein n=1 Tax=Rufibacter hautae TaxID=2595005 RepID=A0A5B6TLY3_9BACT|nr:hypothetical protein [Rufibacter hautae]KAA3437102.1 hypothetical protein FOA19_22310 [Rufibacter hautae]